MNVGARFFFEKNPVHLLPPMKRNTFVFCLIWQHCYTELSVCVQSKVNRTRIYMRSSWLVNVEKYGTEERAFIVEHFLKSASYVVTIHVYRSKFQIASHKPVPTRKTVNNWVKNFWVSAPHIKKKGKEKTVRTPENIQKVKESFQKSLTLTCYKNWSSQNLKKKVCSLAPGFSKMARQHSHRIKR